MVLKARHKAIGVLLALLLLAKTACHHQSTEDQGVEDKMPDRSIEQVMNDHAAELMAIEGVTGVAISKNDDGTPCIMILILKDNDEIRKRLPDSIEGHPVCLFESGEIHPMKDGGN